MECNVRCLAAESAFAEQGVPFLLQKSDLIEGGFLLLAGYGALVEEHLLVL